MTIKVGVHYPAIPDIGISRSEVKAPKQAFNIRDAVRYKYSDDA